MIKQSSMPACCLLADGPPAAWISAAHPLLPCHLAFPSPLFCLPLAVPACLPALPFSCTFSGASQEIAGFFPNLFEGCFPRLLPLLRAHHPELKEGAAKLLSRLSLSEQQQRQQQQQGLTAQQAAGKGAGEALLLADSQATK